MGLLSNRVSRESLKPGDHIYSWRASYIYSHHGIYVGDDKVVHFTRHGREVGTGTFLDALLISSGSSNTLVTCPTCTPQNEGDGGVLSSCLNCFLSGGNLYRFEYNVNPVFFIAKARGGTCTQAVAEADNLVVHRATHLLENGFGCYNVFKNNCEDFAIFCKTGLLVVDQGAIGSGGQAAAIIGGPLAAILATPLRLVTTNICGMAASAVVMYCANRYAADIGSGMRKDVMKVSAEELTTRLSVGVVQAIEPCSSLSKITSEWMAGRASPLPEMTFPVVVSLNESTNINSGCITLHPAMSFADLLHTFEKKLIQVFVFSRFVSVTSIDMVEVDSSSCSSSATPVDRTFDFSGLCNKGYPCHFLVKIGVELSWVVERDDPIIEFIEWKNWREAEQNGRAIASG